MLYRSLSLLTASLALMANAGPTCDALDALPKVELSSTDIHLEGRDLVLTADGGELIHVDAKGKLFVERRPVAVPIAARPHLEAYVDGFRRLGDDAKAIGVDGAKLGFRAASGLVDVLFTSKTVGDLGRDVERAGAQLDERAEQLCAVVAQLQRTERELQLRIPAFPAFLAPVQIAL